jgi:CHAD domain-containing protein
VTRTTAVFIALLLPAATLAQQAKLPDPDKVAPEYRDAAQKRRQQVIRRMGCMLNADKDKVLKRDLATYINRCMESLEGERTKQ